MLFGLALSSEHLCVFGLHINFFCLHPFFPFSELSVVRMALDVVD